MAVRPYKLCFDTVQSLCHTLRVAGRVRQGEKHLANQHDEVAR